MNTRGERKSPKTQYGRIETTRDLLGILGKTAFHKSIFLVRITAMEPNIIKNKPSKVLLFQQHL
jgi:hypothetical protein